MKHLIRTTILFAVIFLTAPHALTAETFPARVVEVVDGDTLRVMRTEGGTIKVRLFGIDCPEKGQRYGKEARRLAHRLSYGPIESVSRIDRGRVGGFRGGSSSTKLRGKRISKRNDIVI